MRRTLCLALLFLMLAGDTRAQTGDALPKPGKTDPVLTAAMTRLLTAKGIRPERLVLVEPDWQLVRNKKGFLHQRTRNAALLYRTPDGKTYRRYVLFAQERSRRNDYGTLTILDLGKPVGLQSRKGTRK